MEGDLAQCLEIVRNMNEEMIAAGCASVISQIKIAYNPQGISMDKLTEKYDQ
jgi:uncharacterized protein YqgV (UPF0045/DUF77 family)